MGSGDFEWRCIYIYMEDKRRKTERERERERSIQKESYLGPRGSLAGRSATAATAEGKQRKQQRRRRWLEGLLRPPY